MMAGRKQRQPSRPATGAERQLKYAAAGRQIACVIRDPVALAALDALVEKHGGVTATPAIPARRSEEIEMSNTAAIRVTKAYNAEAHRGGRLHVWSDGRTQWMTQGSRYEHPSDDYVGSLYLDLRDRMTVAKAEHFLAHGDLYDYVAE